MMRATKGYAAPETLRVFARARELLDVRATVNEQKAVLYGLWSVHYTRAEHIAAREVAQQCVELAAQHRDTYVPALANMLMGCSLWAMGAFADSRGRLEQARQLSALDSDDAIDSRFSLNNGIAAQAFLAWALWPLGYPEQAVAAAAEAVECARRTGHVPLMAGVLYQESFLRAAFGAQEQALTTHVDNAVAYCAEHHVTAYEHWARFCRGIALTRGGETLEGIEIMRATMEEAEKIDARFLRPLHLGHLAAAHASIGQSEAGLRLLDQAINIAGETQEQFFAAELHRLKGWMLLELGNNQGGAELERALSIARGQQARLWELRAAMSLARLWCDQGRRADARDLLAPIYGWFTEGFGTPVLKEAAALLDELG